jgi:hypothetical protein
MQHTQISTQEWTLDALEKLTPREKATSLNPPTMAAILEVGATLQVLNSKFNRSKENRPLLQGLQGLLTSAGENVYRGAKPRNLLDILMPLNVLGITVGMESRKQQLQACVSNDDDR